MRGVCLGIGQAGTVVVEQGPRGQGTAVPGSGGRALQLLLCCLCTPWSRGLWPSSSGSPPWAGRGNTRAEGACYLSLQEDPRIESRATPSCQGQGQEVRVLRGQACSYAFLHWGQRDTSAGRRKCHKDRPAVTDAPARGRHTFCLLLAMASDRQTVLFRVDYAQRLRLSIVGIYLTQVHGG